MFGPPGHAYVYRSYGIHWCLNFVCDGEGVASAVLVRALEPTHGLERCARGAGVDDPRAALLAGPGRLCQALGVTRAHDGLPLDRPPFALRAAARTPEIVAGPRIGITKAAERPWRYGLAGSRYLSRAAQAAGRERRHPGRGGDARPRAAGETTRPLAGAAHRGASFSRRELRRACA